MFKFPRNIISNPKIIKKKINTINHKNYIQIKALKSNNSNIILPQNQTSEVFNDGKVLP